MTIREKFSQFLKRKGTEKSEESSSKQRRECGSEGNQPNQVKDGSSMMYADDTTLYTIGSSIDQVISSLNVMTSQISKWSSLNKLTIHPLKTEAMILAKQQFIGPLQPLHFGSGFVKLVNSTSCLGVTIDN